MSMVFMLMLITKSGWLNAPSVNTSDRSNLRIPLSFSLCVHDLSFCSFSVDIICYKFLINYCSSCIYFVLLFIYCYLFLLLFQNERQRLMRRNIVRYAVLAYVITLQRISLRVKKRFPSWQHVVDSGKIPILKFIYF